MVPLSFGGHDFLASPAGALFWPSERALLVADLHLEKASWFARLGQFLPPYDSQATLAALTEDVDATGAVRLFCLGDSFHGRFGCDRLPGPARDIVALNAGASIYVAGLAPTLAAGVQKAQAVIASGAPRKKLDAFVGFTQAHG